MFLFLFTFLGFSDAFGQTTETITTTGAGTWIVPCGVTSITVEAWGAGGAGGGCTSDNDSGDGGGSGAYTSGIFAVTAGSNIAYTIGTGGVGSTNNGTDGGDTTILGMIAGGGQGGNRNGGTVTGIGGTASGGTINTNGNNGTAGGTGTGGDGGDAPNGGNGGNGISNGNGQDGSNPGGGGGGGERIVLFLSIDRSGGNGGDGQIRITYTSSLQAYCAPTFTTVEPITNVTFAGINNTTSNAINGTPALESFCQTASVMQGSATNAISIKGNTNGSYTTYVRAYIDWDQNGTFGNNANEIYDLGTIANSTGVDAVTLTSNIAVPMTAAIGNTRMRIIKNYNAYVADPCASNTYGQAEDYTVNVVAPPCVAPTVQPTALNLTPTGTSIAGSFTAASPAPNSYLVVVSTSATPPSAPIDGTTYAIGSSLASGYIVVDNDTNTTFTATGLNTSTAYYFYIFSYNNLCTGGPLYNGTSPLTGNATTTAVSPVYCSGNPSSTNSSVYISSIRSVGTILDATNAPTIYSAGGYGNYTGTTIATQVAGGGVNLEIIVTGSYGTANPPLNTCPSNTQFIKTWVDWNKDGDFDDAGEQVYVSGTDLDPVATALDNIYGFVIPPGTFPGNYRMRIRTRAYCDSSVINPCGAHTTGETEDYTLAVVEDCPSKILTVTNGSACGPSNTVTLNATKTASATGFRWYTTLSGGAPVATTTTGSWTTTSISATTTYYVTAYDDVCETKHRTPVVATILPTSNITLTPLVPEVCGEGNVVQITAAGDFVRETLILQDFESGMGSWNVTTPVNTNEGADTPWSVKTSVYVPSGTAVWRPALNSGAVGTLGNKFAFTTSDYNGSNIQTIMTSPVIDASLYTSLDLTFDQMYGDYSADSAIIEASTDGTTWTAIASYTADIGTPSAFVKMPAILLNTYAGSSTLQIRFVYTATWADGWAVDNIKIEGVRPLNTNFTWTDGTVEAFTDAACTTLYTNQAVTTVYVRPTPSQLASASWSFTANATLGNGCTIAQPITINNKTKLWKGTINDDWYEAGNWEPAGVPDINTCVYIYDGPFDANINNTGNNAYGKILTVRPNGLLEIQPNNDLTIDDVVTVDAGGTFHIENSGSLIQIQNVANTGTITMRRNATLKALDYVYWSSPVANFASSAISPATPTGLIWKWEPTTSTSYTNQFGNWVNGNETMTIGRGYIVRSPNGWPTGNTTFTANFVGVPNNGTILRPITRWTYTGDDTAGPTGTLVTEDDDNWNLLGNPYPSAIDALAFLSANTNTTHIYSFVDLWTHGASPAAIADPFYQDYQLNYNPNDYLRYNSTGGTQHGFDGKIGAGQGFFVLMRDAGTTTENAIFNNSMRSNTHRNDQFFRTSATNEITSEIERHRIWLKMVAPNLVSTDMLVGYVAGATNTLDDSFDAMNRGVKVNYELYSLAENQGLLIQGRSLPFDTNDQIPLGVKIAQNGIHTIAISAADGLFGTTTQDIYLEDRTLGITHDLRTVPYSFTAAPGTYENRFVLKFNNETLGTNDLILDEASVWVFSDHSLTVKSSKNEIQSVRVFDLMGRALAHYPNVNSMEVPLTTIQKNDTGLIIQVTLSNGTVVTKKTLY